MDCVHFVHFVHSFSCGRTLSLALSFTQFLLDSFFGHDLYANGAINTTATQYWAQWLRPLSLSTISFCCVRLKQHDHNRLEFESIRFWWIATNTYTSTFIHRHISIIAFISIYLYIVRHSDQTAKINLSTVIHFLEIGCRITNSFVCLFASFFIWLYILDVCLSVSFVLVFSPHILEAKHQTWTVWTKTLSSFFSFANAESAIRFWYSNKTKKKKHEKFLHAQIANNANDKKSISISLYLSENQHFASNFGRKHV